MNNRFSDEALFYGGMVIAGCAVIAAVLFFFIHRLKIVRLEYQLKEEYGEHKKLKLQISPKIMVAGEKIWQKLSHQRMSS